jgi:hypothetical protein
MSCRSLDDFVFDDVADAPWIFYAAILLGTQFPAAFAERVFQKHGLSLRKAFCQKKHFFKKTHSLRVTRFDAA